MSKANQRLELLQRRLHNLELATDRIARILADPEIKRCSELRARVGSEVQFAKLFFKDTEEAPSDA